jgi:hypothetical protein
MISINSPQQQERRCIRYPLHLPVSVKLAHKEMLAYSKNISLGGILLSSAFRIPEGSAVELAVTVAHLPDPGIQLSARGKVLRVERKVSGDFAVAIALERPFEFGRQGLDLGSDSQVPQRRNRVATNRELYFAPAWHTET